MRPQEVKKYFDEYIFGFIKTNIQREIDLAHVNDSGGNFLAALGLLCYTEFMGKIVLKGKGSYTKQFKAFFCLMGEDYKQLFDEKEVDVYKIFRCGMANTYFAGDCDIKMFNNDYPAGIIIKPEGKYIFIVEKYFEDFMNACEKVYDDTIADEYPYLPSR